MKDVGVDVSNGRTSVNPRARGLGCGVALIVCAAILAACSYLAAVNEYASVFGREMAGAYDCDGPANVLMLSIPALMLALVGGVLTFRVWRTRRSRRALLALCLGIAVLFALARRTPAVIAELKKNNRADSPCR